MFINYSTHFNGTHVQADTWRPRHSSSWISLLNEMHINKRNLSVILPQATIIFFPIFCTLQQGQRQWWIQHPPLGLCREGHHKHSNWKTLTLPRTGGQTTFLLRSERPFSHYAAALIYRNTEIQLNGAIFSFAFGGHFSCLENYSHSNSTSGSIVIIASSVRVSRPGLHSLADTHGPQQELTLLHPPSCVARGQQQRQSMGDYCPMVWSIKEKRIHQWHNLLGKPRNKHWTYYGAT